jgi:hypothetical protein
MQCCTRHFGAVRPVWSFAPTTNKDEQEKNQTNEPGASKLVLPLKTQTKRDDITQASWVRNSFGAKQGQRCGVPQCQEASKRCAECWNAGGHLRTDNGVHGF